MLIALLSVFLLVGVAKSSTYWLAAVGAFWLGGDIELGGIPFVVLHHLGLRQWHRMTLVGAAVMLMVGFFMFGEISGPENALVMAAIGSVIGWIIWRVAYRRAPLER